MVKIDEQFIKEKINPVVGFIFHTARQLGAENAPNSMDMEYLRQGTERVKALIEESAALASPRREEWVPGECCMCRKPADWFDGYVVTRSEPEDEKEFGPRQFTCLLCWKDMGGSER
jgi:hypothetical protein